MKTLGNIIWVIFGGLEFAIIHFALGIVCFATIVGFPLGIQMFKIGAFVIWPFGKKVVSTKINTFKKVLNIIWLILFGWEIALFYLIVGGIYFITIVGIPFAKQYFKLARFILLPLGQKFR